MAYLVSTLQKASWYLKNESRCPLRCRRYLICRKLRRWPCSVGVAGLVGENWPRLAIGQIVSVWRESLGPTIGIQKHVNVRFSPVFKPSPGRVFSIGAFKSLCFLLPFSDSLKLFTPFAKITCPKVNSTIFSFH